MTSRESISNDPVYYITAAFFALLTTVLPAALGMPNFLPILQALVLTLFIATPIRHHNPKGALLIMAIWLPLQFLALSLLTVVSVGLAERAIHDGFVYFGEITAWLYGSGPLPGGIVTAPVSHLREFAGVVLGGLATGGLVGAWFLADIVNLAGYGTGILVRTLDDGGLWRTLPYWTLVQIAGLGGLLTLCAEPLLTSQWSPAFYWRERWRQLLVSSGLVLIGLLLELFLPNLVTYSPMP